jgi:hypothetical protein
VAAATLLLCILLFPGALLRGELFFERDLDFDWYLRLEAVASAVQQGSWPVWDTSVAFGQPLLADPGTEVLYPATWLALAVPRSAGYTLFVVGHLLLTAVGMARLAGALGAGRVGSLLAALVWVLSGPLQSAVNLRQHFAGAAWIPWVLLALEGSIRRPGWRPFVALGLTLGLQILAGSADLCAMTWALGVAWAALRLLERRRRRPGLVAARLGAAAALAVSLTAVVWWPAAGVLARSPRQALPEDIRTAWSVPPRGLWRLVVPLDPGRVPYSADTWAALYDRPVPPFLASLYLGLPVLAVAGIALASRRRRRRALFFAAVAAGALAFAMGPHGPVYPAASWLLPVLRIFRYPSKATLLVAFAVALLVGLGAAALARQRLRPRILGWLAGALVAAAAAALFGERLWGQGGSLVSPALVALAGGVLALGAHGLLRPRVVVLALAGVCVADLVHVHAHLNATAPAALLFDPPPTVALVDRGEGRRLYVYDYHSVAGTAESRLGRHDPYRHVATPPGWDPRRFTAAALKPYLPPPTGGLFGLAGSYDMDIRGLYSRHLNDLTFFLRHVEGTPVHGSLLRMGAVGTVFSLHDSGLEELPLEAEVPSLFPEAIRVRRVPSALPRSWVVGGVRVADERAAFENLADPSFDPAREVLLPEGRPRSAPEPFVGTSRILRLAPDRVTLETDTSAPGFVVLADAFDPGWRATVDGQPVPVHRANVAFRAVEVAEGRHVVEMVYRPRRVFQGLTVSAAALLLVLGVVAAGARRERRGRPR